MKKENFVFLVLVLRLCQKSSSVKQQNVSAIASAKQTQEKQTFPFLAHAYSPCACAYVASVKQA